MKEELRKKIAKLVEEERLTLREALALEIGINVAKQDPDRVRHVFGVYGWELVQEAMGDFMSS